MSVGRPQGEGVCRRDCFLVLLGLLGEPSLHSSLFIIKLYTNAGMNTTFSNSCVTVVVVTAQACAQALLAGGVPQSTVS